MRRIIYPLLCAVLTTASIVLADDRDFDAEYARFKDSVHGTYRSFRDSANREYARHMLAAWKEYTGSPPRALPPEPFTVPPRVYDRGQQQPAPTTTVPTDIEPVRPEKQPLPCEPVMEAPVSDEIHHTVVFFGDTCDIRLPRPATAALRDCSHENISRRWEGLTAAGMNNTVRDCLEARLRYDLCDWAYLMFLDELARGACADAGAATLLMSYLYCQSGYQMRLATDGPVLMMLYGSRHQVYNKRYFVLGGTSFYPYGECSSQLRICDLPFTGESPMSLIIRTEQKLGGDMTPPRCITARDYPDMRVTTRVPTNLLPFYERYPASGFGDNPLSKWVIYASTPLAKSTRETLYPALRLTLEGCTEAEAVNRLLDWVQTGLEYEYDDKVWGHDRAFFAEESLYYPYCDCEDRVILFTRLVRDLLGLKTAIVYCPGHLTAAVSLGEEVPGDAMMIQGLRYLICDPTYIGAPAGTRMPGLDYTKAQVMTLPD